MAKRELCAFGKKTKQKLVEINQTQKWLIEQVKNDTNLFVDGGYLNKILVGNRKPVKIIESINKILGQNEPAE